jgi:hypothetical protein
MKTSHSGIWYKEKPETILMTEFELEQIRAKIYDKKDIDEINNHRTAIKQILKKYEIK